MYAHLFGIHVALPSICANQTIKFAAFCSHSLNTMFLFTHLEECTLAGKLLLVKPNKTMLTGHFIRYNNNNSNLLGASACLLAQISNELITWLQLNAFRHVDVAQTTC